MSDITLRVFHRQCRLDPDERYWQVVYYHWGYTCCYRFAHKLDAAGRGDKQMLQRQMFFRRRKTPESF